MLGAGQEQDSRALLHQRPGIPTRMGPVAQQTLVGLRSSVHKGSSVLLEEDPDPLCPNLNTNFIREGMGKGNNGSYFSYMTLHLKVFLRTCSSSGHSQNNPVQQTQQFRDNSLGVSTFIGTQQVGLPCYLWEAFCCTPKPDYQIY